MWRFLNKKSENEEHIPIVKAAKLLFFDPFKAVTAKVIAANGAVTEECAESLAIKEGLTKCTMKKCP